MLSRLFFPACKCLFYLGPTGSSSIQPTAISYNSTCMHLTWNEPGQPNGIIKRYEVYRYEKPNFVNPILTTSTIGTVRRTTIFNLLSYTQYQFSVKACNVIACTTHSVKIVATTKASAPIGQSFPIATIYNSSTVVLSWQPPSILNGPSSLNYIVERILPYLNHPPSDVIKGVRFPGFGFYQFSGSLITSSATTRVEFYFKTRYADGLIFFASSQQQEDIMVIELRDGSPWFIFDTESGPAAFTISINKRFDDNEWHHALVTRDLRDGTIMIDRKYSGAGSGSGLKNVIGQISNVFLGGLPSNFNITRKTYGNTTLKRRPFIGCMKGFKYKNTLVNFETAIKTWSVSPLSSFCPGSYGPGLYFTPGSNLVLKKGVFKGGQAFSLKFKLKTSSEVALILYAFAKDVLFLVYLKNKNMYLEYQTAASNGLYALSSFPLCDGKWHSIRIENSARQIFSYIDGNMKSITTFPLDFIITSETFIGGAPISSEASTVLISKGLTNSLSGCIDELVIDSMVYLPSVVLSHHNIEFDGCPPAYSTVSCNNEKIEKIYDGSSKTSTSTGLDTYTEYLYRVKSYHKNIPGFGVSDWMPVRSGEGGEEICFLYSFNL